MSVVKGRSLRFLDVNSISQAGMIVIVQTGSRLGLYPLPVMRSICFCTRSLGMMDEY